ncbi:hypothetical protein Scep_021551 [Stephania cephalantha]|uniref:Uncharacterized protein n=1 Tax=Stephania cephalantha TaxID=152367 RepID=A0AAP0F6C3_9MAGN
MCHVGATYGIGARLLKFGKTRSEASAPARGVKSSAEDTKARIVSEFPDSEIVVMAPDLASCAHPVFNSLALLVVFSPLLSITSLVALFFSEGVSERDGERRYVQREERKRERGEKREKREKAERKRRREKAKSERREWFFD